MYLEYKNDFWNFVMKSYDKHSTHRRPMWMLCVNTASIVCECMLVVKYDFGESLDLIKAEKGRRRKRVRNALIFLKKIICFWGNCEIAIFDLPLNICRRSSLHKKNFKTKINKKQMTIELQKLHKTTSIY